MHRNVAQRFEGGVVGGLDEIAWFLIEAASVLSRLTKRTKRSAVGVGAAPGAAIPQLMSWA